MLNMMYRSVLMKIGLVHNCLYRYLSYSLHIYNIFSLFYSKRTDKYGASEGGENQSLHTHTLRYPP